MQLELSRGSTQPRTSDNRAFLVSLGHLDVWLPTFSPANKIASFVDSSIIQFDANDSVTVFGVTGLTPGQSPAAQFP